MYKKGICLLIVISMMGFASAGPARADDTKQDIAYGVGISLGVVAALSVIALATTIGSSKSASSGTGPKVAKSDLDRRLAAAFVSPGQTDSPREESVATARTSSRPMIVPDVSVRTSGTTTAGLAGTF